MSIADMSISRWRTRANQELQALQAAGYVTAPGAADLLGLPSSKARLLLGVAERTVKHGGRGIGLWRREAVLAIAAGKPTPKVQA